MNKRTGKIKKTERNAVTDVPDISCNMPPKWKRNKEICFNTTETTAVGCIHIIISLVVLRSGNRRGGAGSGGPYSPGEGIGPGPGAPA